MNIGEFGREAKPRCVRAKQQRRVGWRRARRVANPPMNIAATDCQARQKRYDCFVFKEKVTP